MSKKLITMGLMVLTSYSIPSFAQTTGQPQPETAAPASGTSTAPSTGAEGRIHDEGQVQPPREGQVETVPEGHVEAVNPTVVDAPAQDMQPDLFRFESRLFNPMPSD
ncbi:MAG TPA: hypothetical protein VE954_12205 [Oligoflexus sp.]|uniref:hypothetical protein n=1 Tax=Oligoflexus sp. TaxID=1971216 RepID=UPI002D4F7636|nr:hypothetical protein [Oligoflexus sp.]HYX33869.1 hypothetical protein [Oligoflexus sp.]